MPAMRERKSTASEGRVPGAISSARQSSEFRYCARRAKKGHSTTTTTFLPPSFSLATRSTEEAQRSREIARFVKLENLPSGRNLTPPSRARNCKFSVRNQSENSEDTWRASSEIASDVRVEKERLPACYSVPTGYSLVGEGYELCVQ